MPEINKNDINNELLKAANEEGTLFQTDMLPSTNEMTNEDIDTLAKALEDSRVDTTPTTPISTEDEYGTGSIDSNGHVEIDNNEVDNDIEKIFPSIDDIEDIPDPEETTELSDSAKAALGNNAKQNFNLNDEEMIQLIDCISHYKKDKNYPVYKNLPASIKADLAKAAVEAGYPMSSINQFARYAMDQLINSAELEGAFVDLEKSIDDALNIPSISDLYSEHVSKVMDEIIPESIDRIREEYPEKADMLEKVRDAFHRAYSLEDLKTAYESNARIRKAVRKYNNELDKELNYFNHKNEKTNFKMIDVTEVPTALFEALVTYPMYVKKMHDEAGDELPELYKKIMSYEIEAKDIDKLSVLMTKSCENLNPEDLIDASYMYYLTKNMVVLKYSQEAKTDFAAELINNVCGMIAFIREKEAEFNESNLDKSKSSKKLHSSKSK